MQRAIRFYLSEAAGATWLFCCPDRHRAVILARIASLSRGCSTSNLSHHARPDLSRLGGLLIFTPIVVTARRETFRYASLCGRTASRGELPLRVDCGPSLSCGNRPQ